MCENAKFEIPNEDLRVHVQTRLFKQVYKAAHRNAYTRLGQRKNSIFENERNTSASSRSEIKYKWKNTSVSQTRFNENQSCEDLERYICFCTCCALQMMALPRIQELNGYKKKCYTLPLMAPPRNAFRKEIRVSLLGCVCNITKHQSHNKLSRE